MKEENKIKYRDLCKAEKTIPLFSKDWYLDAVCGENGWDVVTVEQNNEIVAALPYKKYNRYGFKGMCQPALTPRLGVWIKYPKDQKYVTRLDYEKNINFKLISNMPKVDFFYQNFSYSFTNWLPFYWRGFNQTTKYSYLLDGSEDLQTIFNNLDTKTRRNIKKAQSFVEIYEEDDIEVFYNIQKMTFERQNLSSPFTLDFLRNFDDKLKANKARKIFAAKDKENNIHTASYIVWDEKMVYGLMTGNNTAFRNSGANSLILWHIINFAKENNKGYDFCGSVIESIESFCRRFGLKQTPYYVISKNFNNRYIVCKFIVNIIRNIIKR